MTSLKQKAANRRNGLHSKGPRTEAGRIRSSINARKHGLTSPIEATSWGAVIRDVQALLAEEEIGSAATLEVARRIVEFERNLADLRERFEGVGKPVQAIVPDNVLEDLALAAAIADLRAQGQETSLGFDKPLAREIQKFFEQTARRQIRQAEQKVTQERKNSDRYLRRAANQLIKQLKGLGVD